MDKDLIRQQRQSHEARLKQAREKLERSKIHLDAAIENDKHLRKTIKDAEQALKDLPPLEFTPVCKEGSYFPNIYYNDVYNNDVYNNTAGGNTVDRMAKQGLLCETKQDAHQISDYLKVIGKIANYAMQANRRSVNGTMKHAFIVSTDVISVVGLYETMMPFFNDRDDALTVLNKYLTGYDKQILKKGIKQ